MLPFVKLLFAPLSQPAATIAQTILTLPTGIPQMADH